MILEIFQFVIAGALGAIFGSYATLFAHRLPIEQSCFGRYFGPKSHCPKCKKILRTRELIPLINWVVTRGKCSGCGSKIPRAHLFLELSITILFLANFYLFRFSDEFIIYSVIITASMVGLVTDFKHNFLPNPILFIILTAGLVNRALIDQTVIDVIFSGAVGIIASAFFYKTFYQENGEGFLMDQSQAFAYAKFIAIAGVCFSAWPFILYLACVFLILSIFLLFGKFTPKRSPRLGICLIVPFIWLLLYSPLNY